MKISDSIKSVWLDLFGRKLDRCLVEGDKLIQVWKDIYSGCPEWQKYTSRGLYGQRTEWRFLLNAAKMLTGELAGLIFAEDPVIDADPAVIELLEENKFLVNLQSWVDISMALGNGALKWTVKDGKLIIDFVRATDFMPVTYGNGGVTEADFASTLVKDGKEFKIVEQHRVADVGYTISLKAYKKNGNGEFKECTAAEAGIDDSTTTIPTTRPLFVVWRNPEANNINLYSPLGISIFANSIDTIRQIDEAFDNLAHERVGTRRKIIIGSSMISTTFDTAKKKQDVYYDKNDDVYVAFDDAEKEQMMPKEINFDFRIDAITKDINLGLSLFCKQCGMSDNFLSFDGASMKTATEVVSENSKSFRKKQAIENSLTPVIISFIEAIKDIGPMYGIAVSEKDYSITWDDSVIEDRAAKETRIINRYNAKLMTLEDALVALDGLSPEEAAEKARQIRDQNKTVDVGSLFGNDSASQENAVGGNDNE